MGSSCQFVFHSFSVGRFDSLVMFCSCCDMLLILPTIMQWLGCYALICLNKFLLRHNVSSNKQLVNRITFWTQLLWTTITDEGVVNYNNSLSIITIKLVCWLQRFSDKKFIEIDNMHTPNLRSINDDNDKKQRYVRKYYYIILKFKYFLTSILWRNTS